MKFVALALALLLAVGSHAASLQADSPSSLAHVRSVIDISLNRGTEIIKNALQQLSDEEYKDTKLKLLQYVDEAHAQIKALQAQISPITDNVVNTISEITADFRTSLINDIEALKTEIEPKRAKLREVVHKHIEEYRALLQPILDEYYAKHTADMDALKIKLEPIVEELRTKVATNVEETKSALVPILESVRTTGNKHLENLKVLIGPQVEEYKDQLKQAYSQAQNIKSSDLTALREKLVPLFDQVKANVHAIFETVAGTFVKS